MSGFAFVAAHDVGASDPRKSGRCPHLEEFAKIGTRLWLRAAHPPGSSARLVLNPGFCPGLSCPLKEAERRLAHHCSLAPPKRCLRALRHARLPALHRGDFLHGHRTSWPGPEDHILTLSGRHWRRRSSRPVQPFKADPSSGSGSDRASWDGVSSPRLQAPPSRLRQPDDSGSRPQ